MDEAEQIFRRLNVKNRAALLGCFKRALEAENSAKKSPDPIRQPDYGSENTEKTPGRALNQDSRNSLKLFETSNTGKFYDFKEGRLG
jgi:hypothetical protein